MPCKTSHVVEEEEGRSRVGIEYYAAFAPIVSSSVPKEASLLRWREKIVFPDTLYTPVLY